MIRTAQPEPSPTRAETRDRVLVLAAAALVAANTVVFASDLLVGTVLPRPVGHVISAVVAALAVPVCRRAARDPKAAPRAARFWRQTTLGMAMIAFALALRPISVFAGGGVLGPLWMAAQAVGAVVLSWSVARVPLGLRTRSERIALWLDMATMLVAAAVLVWHFFGTDAMKTLVGASSPNVGAIMGSALVAVFLAAKAALVGSDLLPRRSLYLRALAALVGGLGSAATALLVTRPDVDAQVLLNPIASLCTALGAWFFVARRPVTEQDKTRRRYSLLPYVAVIAVDGLLVYTGVHGGADRLLIITAAVVLTGLVIVRQLVAFRENDSLLTQLGRHERQLRHDATHDALTGLANRVLFGERVEAALSIVGRRHRPTIVLVDLDDFKTVNDTLGHAAGDALLVAVAQRMRANVRGEDTVARLGGDEFAILFQEMDPAGVERVLARIAEALAMPVQVDEHLLAVRASFGIAEAAGPAADDAGDLMRRADIAMYEAKAAGEGGFERYRPGMRARGAERQHLTAELATAIDEGRLVLHYQPVVTLPDGRITGVEALVRWQHPTRGLLGPGEFVPLAEESGLIVPMGRWVLRAATKEAAAWVADHGLGTVAVNVSAKHLRRSDFAADVASALRDSGLPAQRLTIEITESTAVGGGMTWESLTAVRAMGVRVSLDDFGTGQSTLSLLVQCPVDEIKLDRTFTPAPGPDAIAGAVIQLAQAMGIAAVAEGVETVEQAHALRRLGYVRAQGFHFARPMPADRLVAAIEETAPAAVRGV
jgi:diguanylate cyclase (GGDEF)-like protein